MKCCQRLNLIVKCVQKTRNPSTTGKKREYHHEASVRHHDCQSPLHGWGRFFHSGEKENLNGLICVSDSRCWPVRCSRHDLIALWWYQSRCVLPRKSGLFRLTWEDFCQKKKIWEQKYLVLEVQISAHFGQSFHGLDIGGTCHPNQRGSLHL